MNLYEQYHTLREKRLALQKEADLIEQQEKDILYSITKEFSEGANGYSHMQDGYLMKASKKDVASAVNWEQILQYVKTTGEVDLLQKRLTESAVKARWDAGLTVPGVERAYKWAITVTKEHV